MADTPLDKFQSTVLTALFSAKDELLHSGLELWRTKDAIDELKKLIPLVAEKQFGNFGEGYKFSIVEAFPMLTRIAQRWYKTFLRRMIARCGVRNPWRVEVSEYLSRELFNVFEQLVARTSYGVTCKTTRKRVLIVFSNEARVRHVFCELMGTEIWQKDFLKRSASGRRKVEAIVNEDKQFGVTFNCEKEEITFDFFYGMWNQYGWPQHM